MREAMLGCHPCMLTTTPFHAAPVARTLCPTWSGAERSQAVGCRAGRMRSASDSGSRLRLGDSDSSEG